MDGVDDGESQCDKTHVDDDCQVRCELVHPAVVDGFDEVEIVNEHKHVWITHHRVDEHYGNKTFETWIDCGNIVSTMFDIIEG